MDQFLYGVYFIFGMMMKGCFFIASNYGVAIILFTLLTKIVLMPISIWIQKNSILMVKMQPEINFLKANNQGNLDAIAEGQSKIFKREKYHPMITLIPLILQIVLLLAVVYIIYHPLGYLFDISNDNIVDIAKYLNLNMEDSSFQLQIIEAIKNGTLTVANASQVNIDATVFEGIINDLKDFDINFLGISLLEVPANNWGWYTLVPIAAGVSSFLMCWTQNLSNVIQHEQGKVNKYGIMILSVGLSLYLGIGVPTGIAIYWTASNILSIAIMYLLNWWINPKKYVDYEELEKSREALNNAKQFGKIDKHDPIYKLSKEREKADYKKFKKIANKHIVFYSEKSGFYKYFKDIIAELLAKSNITIHYVTNDYNDQIFEIAKDEPRIKPYYISLKKTVILMMYVECDMFLMTTPDLNTFYLKRSYIKKDIEYVYAPHDLMSAHVGFREGAFDHFDTILCSGEHIVQEIREIEKVYDLKPKNLVEFGYPLGDELAKAGEEANKAKNPNAKVKEILIAPSWQEDNLLDSVIDTLIENLYCDDYHITVRPHPEYIKRYGYQLNELVNRYKDYDPNKLTFELDFKSNKSVYSSDLLITDWSGIGPEFCFATKRPAIFINTKLKCCNPNYEKIKLVPVEISLRSELGVALNKEECNNIKGVCEDLFQRSDEYKEKITKIFDGFIFNHGTAAQVGATYILKSIASKKKKN